MTKCFISRAMQQTVTQFGEGTGLLPCRARRGREASVEVFPAPCSRAAGYGQLVHWRNRLLSAGVCVVIVLIGACGTQRAPGSVPAGGQSSVPAGGESKQPLPGICPQAASAAGASPCVSTGVEQNQQANQSFNDRVPLSAAGAAEAGPITQRIRDSLERLTAAQRLQVSAVRSALLAGGLLSTDLLVSYGWTQAPPHNGVAFGGYELLSVHPAVCAWGTVTVEAIEVDSGGITREGACLPGAGGH
jgi:hypothetical protein